MMLRSYLTYFSIILILTILTLILISPTIFTINPTEKNNILLLIKSNMESNQSNQSFQEHHEALPDNNYEATHQDTPTSYHHSLQKPNIIFIIADDLGINDIGYNAKDINTPNLNYLAKNGIKLSNYYTLCVCSPARSVILTGRYDIHNGMRGLVSLKTHFGIFLNETLISDILYKYGNYNTYAIGKWDVGKSTWKQTPTNRGFSYFYGMLSGATDYYKHTIFRSFDWSEHIGINCNSTQCARSAEETYGTYSTYLITDKVIEIINNHSKTINSNAFFIYAAYQAIHSPPQVPDNYISKYKNKIKSKKRRVVAGMIDCLDEGIGNITQTLIDNNLINDTIIVFTSDNGAPVMTGDSVGGENFPLRGGKHSIWEGGTKVPAIIYFQGLKNSHIQQDDYEQLFHSADWMATLIEAIGLNITEMIGNNNKLLHLDGVSHWENLNKPNINRSEQREWIYYGNDNPNGRFAPGDMFGLRYKEYKMLFNGGGYPDAWYKYEEDVSSSGDAKPYVYAKDSTLTDMYLYNIVEDPLEINNTYMLNGNKQLKVKIQEYKQNVENSAIHYKPPTSCDAVQYVKLNTIDDRDAKKGGMWPGC
eukprot:136448_1